MKLFWTKFTVNFKGEYKDHKNVDIYYEFEVKRNWTYLFCINSTILVRSINHCIQEFLTICLNKNWMYEGENPNRLIREDRLKLINNHINTYWRMYWQPKVLKVRNIKITHIHNEFIKK